MNIWQYHEVNIFKVLAIIYLRFHVETDRLETKQISCVARPLCTDKVPILLEG